MPVLRINVAAGIDERFDHIYVTPHRRMMQGDVVTIVFSSNIRTRAE